VDLHRIAIVNDFNLERGEFEMSESPAVVMEGRSGRTGRLFEAVGSAILSKGVLVVVSLLSIPIAIRYLGAEDFGVWTTISTFLSMLLALDLGVANSLTNFISEAYARNDREHASRYSSTALFLMVMIAAALGLIAFGLWQHFNWYAIFHLSSHSETAAVSRAVAAALLIFLIDLPARLAVTILGGYQELRAANLFAALGGIGNLISIVLLVHLRAGLTAMVAGSACALVGADVICFIWLVCFHKPWLRPRVAHLSRSAARRMMKLSTEFFMLQIAGLIVFNSDNLVVTHYLGPAEVARYSVAWRLVGYAAIIQTFIMPALWPAFAEAFNRGDMRWVRMTFRRTLWITMGAAAFFAIILATTGRWIIRVWATNAAVPTEMLLLLMCLWVLISSFMNNTAIVLNAKGETRLQAWCSVAAAVLNLVLSIYLVQRIGAIGVILGTILSYAAVLIVPQTLQAWRIVYGRPSREAVADI
jgi:O-antigen/teichoic acid export membrane protein